MMKRTATLVLAALALVAAPAAAQSGINLIAGLTSTNLSFEFEDGEEATGFGSRTGFAVGLGIERGTGSGLNFAPELLYVMKGSNEEGGDGFIKLSYVEVPLLFRYYFGSGGSAMPYVTAGPTIAFLASCKVGDDDDSESCDDVFGTDDSYKSIDYGVMVGAGVKFGRFGLSGRYELGLANITEEDCCTEKNTALMILGSIGF
jgi:opacity protein-like surface antigen